MFIHVEAKTNCVVSTARTGGTTGKRSYMSSNKTSAPTRNQKGDFIPLHDVYPSNSKFSANAHCTAA
ncbi:hypothetical protein NHQ30_003179 [Ciborinia camelliae]|nr:hypothetical protein NHQ30_003179 [Ciborinia camelliae]